jgi:hypothetical protein
MTILDPGMRILDFIVFGGWLPLLIGWGFVPFASEPPVGSQHGGQGSLTVETEVPRV